MYLFMLHRPLQIDADEAGPIETPVHRRRQSWRDGTDLRLHLWCRQTNLQSSDHHFLWTEYNPDRAYWARVFDSPIADVQNRLLTHMQTSRRQAEQREFDIGPARQCNWTLRRRRRQLADRATLSRVEINAFGAWGADTDEVDNSPEMAMLGSQAQRDRMYRGMTTVSLHSRHDPIGLISRRLSTRAETCGTSFARKESHGFASLMCVWDRLTITRRLESCHLQLDAFFCGNASSARPIGSCCF